MNKRKIHKYTCIALFIGMAITAEIKVLNIHIWEIDMIDKICSTIGILLETPFVIMFIKYYWDYKKLKKEGNK